MHKELYNLGFSLIPLGDRLKFPVDEWKCYQDQRAKLAQVEQWAAQGKRFGIACGPVSNLAVIDTDNEIAEQWAKDNLPRTPWMVKTAQGFHRYYRFPGLHPIRNTVKLELNGEKVGPDVRGYGGQVVAPGSLHYDDDQNETGYIYAPLNWPWSTDDEVPVFPVEYLPKPEEPKVYAEPRTLETVSDPYETAQKWLDARPTPSKGERDNECYVAACHMYGFGLSNPEVFTLVWNWNCGASDPLTEREVRKCVNSAETRRQTHERHPKGQLERQSPPALVSRQEKEYSYNERKVVPAHDSTQDILTQNERQRIEWEYLVSAWQDEQSIAALTAYNPERWQDSTARACAETLRELAENEGEFDLATVADSMRTKGHLQGFRDLEAFYEKNRHKLKPNSPGAARAFQKAVRWDDYQKVVYDAVESMGKGDPDQALTVLKDAVDTILARQLGVKYKTLRDIVRDRLQKIASGEPDEDKIWIELLSELSGPANLGSVIPICGPPKTGKSFLLRTIRGALNKSGVPSLTSQYELSEAQIAEREIRSRTCTFDEMTPEEAQKLLDSDPFELEDNSIIATKADSIETCRAEVWPILAANPQIKVWLLDYNERIYSLDKNSNQYLEAQRVAKFVKDTASKFGIVAIVLLQPNNKYYENGAKGPEVNQIDFGNKWVKDAGSLWFMHKPSRFRENENAPEDLIEFHLLAGRDSEDRTIFYSQFLPVESRFRKHPDATSLAAQASTKSMPSTFGNTATGKPVQFETVDDDTLADIEFI